MPAASPPVDDLLDAVKRLPPDALAEFAARLAEWQDSPEHHGPSESFLVQQAKQRLPAADAKRLRRLVSQSERGNLSPTELEDFRQLARRAERISSTRTQALAELARRRGQPVATVKQDIGWQDVDHAA